VQDEVNALLEGQLGRVEGLDDELAAMEAELLDEEVADVPKVPTVRSSSLVHLADVFAE
jgi:hypothetical protein